MSLPPRLPGRLLWKKSRCPSTDRSDPASMPEVLMTDPRLTGASQGQSSQPRRATQRSLPPCPPTGRLEVKYRLSPSFDRFGCASRNVELIVAPRFNGSDHLEFANDVAWSLGATGCDSDSHPNSSASAASDNCPAMVVVLMGSPR